MDITGPPQALPVFLAAALRRPGLVGAVAPSSRALGEVLAAVVPRHGRPTVVELGPGTGAVSTVIGTRLPPGGHHLALEIDSRMADLLQASHPQVTVVHGDAVDLGRLLRDQGVARVDAVVSGLPWSLFAEDRQRRVLTQVGQLLTPDGAFCTFAYRHAAWLAGAHRFRRLLDEHFDEVVVTRTVWGNLPPALAYLCRRPIRHAAHG